MINGKQFDNLWNYLLSNPWDFLDKERLPATKNLFYNNLKDYDYDHVWKVFDDFIHNKDRTKLPLIQSVIAAIDKIIEDKNYQNAKPVKTPDNHKLIRRAFLKESGKIVFSGNDPVALKECIESFRNKMKVEGVK